MLYRYVVYGLRLASELELPELEPDLTDGPPDTVLRLADVRGLASQPVASGCFEAGPGYAFLALDRGAVARVASGREVALEPEVGSDPALVRAFVLGAVLALVLGQRGHLVLHASAVALTHGAVAFVGEKGWGKSTTAAALVGRGGSLLTDDLVVLDPCDSAPPCVRAGFAQMRLWPDALHRLGVAADGLPQVFAATEKRRWDAGTFDATAAPPLRALYVLGHGERYEVERLAAPGAVAELLRHSFLRHLIGPTGLAASHLGQVAGVIRSVPVFRLGRPRDLAGLDAFAAFVEEHAAVAAVAQHVPPPVL